jgi:pimeloyl-ACP methyl ester carboxylesterase
VLLFWVGLGVIHLPLLGLAGLLAFVHWRVRSAYIPYVVRMVLERPLFITPRGRPVEGAEDVTFRNAEGLALRGCYIKGAGPRRGVVLFGLEFCSDRWSCVGYCEQLLAAGFDVFAFEPRNQGESEAMPGYDPTQWVTDHDAADFRAALKYLQSRPDADPRGVGPFGISKGAGAGLVAAADEPLVRCAVTDGMFSAKLTLVPFMWQWVSILTKKLPPALLPEWYLRHLARVTFRRVERERGCRLASVEGAVARLAGRPLLMIHGEQDTYIKPHTARALFERAGEPKELWLVPGAKHNQALHVAGPAYRQKVLRFFEEHLASGPRTAEGTEAPHAALFS